MLTKKEELQNYKCSIKGTKKALDVAKKNKCSDVTISLLKRRLETEKRTYKNLKKRK